MHSENADELKHVWTEWRKASGQKVRKLYGEYVALSNEAAVLNSEYFFILFYRLLLLLEVL